MTEKVQEGLKPEHGMRPGWMLRADPELKAKVDANKKKFKEFKKLTKLGPDDKQVKEATELEEARAANTASARTGLAKRPAKPLTGKDAEKKNAETNAAWERLMAHAAAQKQVKEAAEQIDEATPYYNKPSFLKRMGNAAKQERLAREKKEKEGLKGDQHKIDKNKNGKVDAHDFKLLRKEEALNEARINGREYASHGLMHPDHAKMDIHQPSSQHVDFYASGTGDKMQGKVTKNDGKHVHIQAHKDKELGDGKLHRFKITPHLPKATNEEVELEEKMDMKKASMLDVIRDFKKSDAPQFKGKSVEKRREMAIAAKLSNEEVEIDEAVVQFGKKKAEAPREINKDDVENAWALKHIAKKDDKISYQHNGVTIHHGNGDHTFILGGHKPLFDRDPKGKLKFKDDLGAARRAFKMPTQKANKGNVVSLKKEEVEAIDELKKSTLASYVKKAADDRADTGYHSGYWDRAHGGEKPEYKSQAEKEDGQEKRKKGIDRAMSKLTKEEIEQIDELSKGALKAYVAAAQQDNKDHADSRRSGDADEAKYAKDRMVKRSTGIGAAKNRLTKEELHTMSFKSFLEEGLTEGAWPGTPEYKAKFPETSRGKVGDKKAGAKGTQTVTGTGVKHERDYDKAEKEGEAPESQEKRGRGRPKGSASGARQKGSAPKSQDGVDYTGYALHLPGRR